MGDPSGLKAIKEMLVEELRISASFRYGTLKIYLSLGDELVDACKVSIPIEKWSSVE